MRSFITLLLVTASLTLIISCDDFSCAEAQDEISAATTAYTAAIDEGGDGAAECAVLMVALERLIEDSTCPADDKATIQTLLNSLDCD